MAVEQGRGPPDRELTPRRLWGLSTPRWPPGLRRPQRLSSRTRRVARWRRCQRQQGPTPTRRIRAQRAEEKHTRSRLAPGRKKNMNNRRAAPASLLASAATAAVTLALAHSKPAKKASLAAALTSVIAFWLTYLLIPSFAAKLHKRGLAGADLNKQPPEAVTHIVQATPTPPNSSLPKVPEALGVVPGFVYLVAGVICYLVIPSGEQTALTYVSGLLCVVFITFLGFVDDVLDLRWRYKVILPLFASLPLLVIYQGPTSVIVPGALLKFLPSSTAPLPIVVELGVFYYIYMAALTIFCSNAINIYAGLNGLETGQSLVIALAVITHNTIELLYQDPETIAAKQHCLSLMLNLIFLNCTAALYAFNRYPSIVFVGDTFTYFAGVHFAVAAIVGHYAKTLLLFFLPQIINFIVSMPQLFGLIACPRHRVPRLDPKSGKLVDSGNLTVMNLILRWMGPFSEGTLVDILLTLQSVCCVCALLIRYSPIYKSLFL